MFSCDSSFKNNSELNFVVVFLLCRDFLILPQLFCFAVSFVILLQLFSFAVAYLLCHGFFILPQLFCFAVTFFILPKLFLLCCGFFIFHDLFILLWLFLFWHDFLFFPIRFQSYSYKWGTSRFRKPLAWYSASWLELLRTREENLCQSLE